MPGAQRGERAAPRARPAEVRDDHDEPRVARELGDPPQRAGERVGIVVAVGGDALGERAAQRPQRAAPAAGREEALVARAAGQQRDAPSAARRKPPEHDDHALGDVGLQAVGRAEGHRRRDVEDQPRRQRPLGDVQAHVRDARPRAGRRVELANVVAGLVWAQLEELGPRTDPRRAPLAGQDARCPPRHRQVERVDQPRGQRTGALAAGGRGERGARHGARPRPPRSAGARPAGAPRRAPARAGRRP